MDKKTHRIFRFIVRFLLNIIARVELVGLEYIPAFPGYIVATNHVGRLDAAMAYYIFDRPDTIIILAEKYKKYAFYRWLIKITNGMFIDRYNADFGTVRETLRRLKQGQLLFITPEGTRSKSGNLQEGKPGAVYLALKSGLPILPTALTGTDDAVAMDRIKHFKRLHIRAVAGPVFTPPPIAGKDRDAALQQYTEEVMCRIAVLLPPERRGVYADHPRVKELLAGEGSGGA